ncbi:ER membrane protein Wsc4, putative [Trichophyton verrucosum HKI 0517]|uniref:ER membrane protein Wsc4, putative n=1 Tax=Trichophyton verrucosum (strain HKI 0517) TaxID=663202 RepID=D4CZ36_TRIVH|nr:ER membrane protein Wsc4, putative [Trichophyton verrucosum HKI 0517]EFE45135.1 ER membrane protein Wsc4, putative [Trichophyton verrucosum HKI 0517]
MAPNPHGNLISLLFSLLILYPALAAAVDLDYCAEFNTGSTFNSVVDGFQSIGACQKTCGTQYAFAVLQGKTCWCTNAAPKDTIPNGRCNQNCPGYPDDKCGNTSEGLFAYIMLDKKPSTTIGNPSSTTTSSVSSTQFSSSSSTDMSTTAAMGGNRSSSSSSSSLSPSPSPSSSSSTLQSQSPAPEQTSQSTQMILTPSVQTTSRASVSTETRTTTLSPTSTSSSSSSSSSSFSSTSSSSSTKTSKTTTSPASTTTDPTASITTVEGRVTTITVPNAPAQTHPPASNEGSSLSGGAIAGIIIGTLAVFAIFTGIILWLFCFRRRQQAKIDDSYRSPFHESPVPQPIFENTLSSRVPAMRVAPVANGNGTTAGSRGSTARLSIPAFTDHRMKKDALVYSHGGRHSNVSLQDNQDYSRPVLRVSRPSSPPFTSIPRK